MALVIKKNANFKWDVTYKLPVDNEHIEETFRATFKRKKHSWVLQQQKIANTNDGIEDGGVAIAMEVLVGWEGINVTDENGKKEPLKYSEENKKLLLELPLISVAIVAAFYEGITGTKTKNSLEL